MNFLREFVEALGEIAQSTLDRCDLIGQTLHVAAGRQVPEMKRPSHRSLRAAGDVGTDAHRDGGDVCELVALHRGFEPGPDRLFHRVEGLSPQWPLICHDANLRCQPRSYVQSLREVNPRLLAV
jgi:hypothetical protein